MGLPVFPGKSLPQIVHRLVRLQLAQAPVNFNRPLDYFLAHPLSQHYVQVVAEIDGFHQGQGYEVPATTVMSQPTENGVAGLGQMLVHYLHQGLVIRKKWEQIHQIFALEGWLPNGQGLFPFPELARVKKGVAAADLWGRPCPPATSPR